MTRIVVTGGTGVVGRHVLDELDLHDVRAVAHSARSEAALQARGVGQVVTADLGRPAELDAAFDGAQRLFLLTASSPAQADQEMAAVTAARSAGVQRIVKLSSVLSGRGLRLMRPHEQVEAHLATLGDVEVVVLKPDSFLQNELHALAGIAQGAVVAPTGEALIGFVDARDVGAAAAAALTADQAPVGDHVLTGPERLTYAQYAHRLGAVLGRDVRHVSPSEDDFVAGAVTAGLPEYYAQELGEMYVSWRDRGASADAVGDGVQRLTGRPPRPVEAFATDVLAPALAEHLRAGSG